MLLNHKIPVRWISWPWLYLCIAAISHRSGTRESCSSQTSYRGYTTVNIKLKGRGNEETARLAISQLETHFHSWLCTSSSTCYTSCSDLYSSSTSWPRGEWCGLPSPIDTSRRNRVYRRQVETLYQWPCHGLRKQTTADPLTRQSLVTCNSLTIFSIESFISESLLSRRNNTRKRKGGVSYHVVIIRFV